MMESWERSRKMGMFPTLFPSPVAMLADSNKIHLKNCFYFLTISCYMKRKCVRLAVLFLLFILPGLFNQVSAQQAVTGKVLNAQGEPLQGASVTVKGQSKGTSTNEAGSFTLTVDSGKVQQLEISFTGYVTKTIRLNHARNYIIRLEDEVKGLNDVIVIGYGTSRRRDLTGAVGDVKMKDLEKAPVSSFDQALAGRLAGVQVTSEDGQPGVNYNIVIRGGNSITQSNAPLYVIDGFPMEGSDNTVLNPDDIASIEVLKDASSTAIYGARGANGVILITTKQGKTGKTVVTYNGWYGQQKTIKKQEMMSPYEFVRYQLDLNPVSAASLYLKNGKTLDSYRDAEGIDWQDHALRTANMQNHSVAVRGGTDKTKYSFSGNVMAQDGVLLNSGFNRYQGRFNIEQKLSDHFRTGVNVNYAHTKRFGQMSNQTTDNLNGASSGNASSYILYSVWGYRPVSGGDDSQLFEDPFDQDITSTVDLRVNPVINLKNQYNYQFRNSLYANAFLEYAFLNNFKLKVAGGITQNQTRAERFNNSNTAAGSPFTTYGANFGINGSISNSYTSSWLNENTLSYDKLFNGKHKLNVIGGFTLQRNDSKANSYTAIQLPNESLGVKGLEEGTLFNSTSTGSYSTLASFLGRVNYSFKSKYLFTVSYRADGSSKFANGKRWGYFPSAAFAWQLGDEQFIKNIDAISNAKFRVSYGITGNNRVSDFAYLSVLRQNVSANSANTNSGYYFNNQFVQGTVPTEVGNNNLVWEKTGQFDLGLDLGLFGNRISVTADYYHKRTNDLLLDATLASSTGYATAFKNIGSVTNRGFEFTLNTVNIETKNFTWSSSFNIAFNRNRVEELNYDQSSLTTRVGSWSSNFTGTPYIALPGREVALFYGYVFDGLYQYEDFDQLANGTYVLKANVPNNGEDASTIKPGFIKYKDINGDGIVDANDQTVIGNPIPDHIGGFSNNFRYKQFDLNIFFQWTYGNDLLNANKIVFEGAEKRANVNMLAEYANRWTPDNTNSLLPVAGGYGPNFYSSRNIEDGSFLRLKTIALGYNLPKSALKKMKIQDLRVYTSAQNIITWTNYSGVNPEVSVRDSPLTPGFDWSAYPQARTITLGLNVTF